MTSMFARKRLPFRKIDSYSVIHRGAQQIFLNETGTRIWELLDRYSAPLDIARTLASPASSVPLEKIVSDVEIFLEGLYERRFLMKSQDGVFKEWSSGASPANLVKKTAGQRRSPAQAAAVSYQEQCMTPQLSGPTQSLRDAVERVYWEKRYIYKMHLELTYRCNFRCVHCYNPTHVGGKSELSTAEWNRVLGELAELNCYFLTFTGGEPLARKDLPDILQAACEHNFSFRLNTNGSLVDEKLVNRLAPMRPFLQAMDVSFYGALPEIHDALARSPGSFEKTMRAVRLISEAKLGLVTKFITMRDNIDGISRFEEDMQRLGVSYSIGTESLIPRTDRNSQPLVQLLTNQQYKALLSVRDVASADGPQACRPGHVRGAITPEGFVSPCEWLTDFRLGNLREHSLREIWYGQGFRSFRKVFEQDAECSTCDLYSGCRRCPAHSYLETGSLLSCAPIQRNNAELYRAVQASQAN